MNNFAKPALILIAGLVVGAMLLIATPAFSQGIVGSMHDMTTATGNASSTTGDTTEVCVFCHSPHGTPSTPLWNRAGAGWPPAYTMYDNTYSATIGMTVAAQPQDISLACLSCHDGQLAYDSLINATTTASGIYNYDAAGVDMGWTFTNGDTMTTLVADVAMVGTDLTDDHPISITYDPAIDTAFQPQATAETAGLVFFGPTADQVECGTCHAVHDPTIVPFLRMSNAASAMCTACHIK